MEEKNKYRYLQITAAFPDHPLIIRIDRHDLFREQICHNCKQDRSSARNIHRKSPDLLPRLMIAGSPVLGTEHAGAAGYSEAEDIIKIIILVGQRGC